MNYAVLWSYAFWGERHLGSITFQVDVSPDNRSSGYFLDAQLFPASSASKCDEFFHFRKRYDL